MKNREPGVGLVGLESHLHLSIAVSPWHILDLSEHSFCDQKKKEKKKNFRAVTTPASKGPP